MTKQLTFQITGKIADNGDVEFSDFIKQLDYFKKALIEVDRLVTKSESVYYRVVGLSYNSPATISLEAVPLSSDNDTSEIVINKFVEGIDLIQNSNVPPPGFDFITFQAYKKMTSMIGKSIGEISISNGHNPVYLPEALGTKINTMLGPDQIELGSVVSPVSLVK